MTIKERCQKYHEQNCDFCEDLTCCDNTNKYLKLQSENRKLKELLRKASEYVLDCGDGYFHEVIRKELEER